MTIPDSFAAWGPAGAGAGGLAGVEGRVICIRVVSSIH